MARPPFGTPGHPAGYRRAGFYSYDLLDNLGRPSANTVLPEWQHPRVGDLAAPCEGTFYVWLRLPEHLTPERLLDEHRLVVAPGEGFGPSGEGWARISLATPDELIDLGLERLTRALDRG